MGTRCGDIDPAIPIVLQRSKGMTHEQVDTLLNRKSGMLGISEVSSDMRDINEKAAAGHAQARLALEIFAYRIKKYIGAYMAAMNGADLIIFTAGIGERGLIEREMILENMEFLGIVFDQTANLEAFGKTGTISKPDSRSGHGHSHQRGTGDRRADPESHRRQPELAASPATHCPLDKPRAESCRLIARKKIYCYNGSTPSAHDRASGKSNEKDFFCHFTDHAAADAADIQSLGSRTESGRRRPAAKPHSPKKRRLFRQRGRYFFSQLRTGAAVTPVFSEDPAAAEFQGKNRLVFQDSQGQYSAMIKKYPWHFIFALFILISLANIFQKLKWSSVSDHLVWENSDQGLVCAVGPGQQPDQAGRHPPGRQQILGQQQD